MIDAPSAPVTGGHLAGQATILLAGAGRMGGALLEAWLDGGVAPQRVTVVDPQLDPAFATKFTKQGVALNPTVVRATADVMVLAIKPQMLDAGAPGLAAHAGPGTLLVSVVAGKTIADLRRAFPAAGAVARAMPNTPAAIRRGIAGVVVEPQATAAQKAAIAALLGAVGAVEWLADEAQIDAVTAVSGSGPAYVFLLAECLAQAGEAAGLEPGLAMRLARATVEGAGALMAARPEDAPALLRRNVTSPGGTTAAALDVLMGDDALAVLMRDAVLAARRRAEELGG